MSAPHPDAERLAQRFHETYERLAPQFGYKTRDASAVPWSDVPEQNKALMIATVNAALLAERPAPTPHSHGVPSVWCYDDHTAERPAPTPDDREALTALIAENTNHTDGDWEESDVADALIAAGWRR